MKSKITIACKSCGGWGGVGLFLHESREIGLLFHSTHERFTMTKVALPSHSDSK